VIVEHFPFEFDRRFVVPLRLLGVTKGNSGVVLDDAALDVRFGPWRLRTPVGNLRDVQITRDYRWFKAIGPRGSMTDHGVTFGTNARAGVCVCFHEPVGALLGPQLMRHPGMTVTVRDVDGFAAAVRRRIEG
jgi:hypothetical protein